MKSSVKECSVYFRGFVLLVVTGILFLLVAGKTVSFLSLNGYHSFWLNIFFIYYTFAGNGLFAVCLIAFYFFVLRRKQQGFALLYSFIISGLIVVIIKDIFPAPRPGLFFEHSQQTFFIKGITLHGNNSFPSGHTATAFAIATVVVMMAHNKKLQLFVLFAAALVAYSRIYLSQHFLGDVLAGAVIGVTCGIASVWLAKKPLRINFFNVFKHAEMKAT